MIARSTQLARRYQAQAEQLMRTQRTPDQRPDPPPAERATSGRAPAPERQRASDVTVRASRLVAAHQQQARRMQHALLSTTPPSSRRPAPTGGRSGSVGGSLSASGTARARTPRAGLGAGASVADVFTAPGRVFGELTRAGGSMLQDSGRALEGLGVPGGRELRGLGGRAREFGAAVRDNPEVAARAVRDVSGHVVGMLDRGRELLDGVRATAEARVNDAVELGQRGLRTIQDGLGTFRRDLQHANDYDARIRELGVGDTYSAEQSGSASARIFGVGGRSNLEVERQQDGRYQVSVLGEAGIRAQLDLTRRARGGGSDPGAQLDGALDANARAEMTFDTADDAIRAVEIIGRQQAVLAASGGNPGMMLANQLAMGPSADDARFLARNTSAIELGGSASASIAARLGLPEQLGSVQAELGGEASGSSNVRARIELEGGRPTHLLVGGEVSSRLAGDAAGGRQRGEAESSLTVASDLRFRLPSGSQLQAFLRDPAGQVDRLPAPESRLRATLDGGVSHTSSGLLTSTTRREGVRTQLAVDTSLDAALRSGVLDPLARGDMEGAMAALGDRARGELTITPYSERGVGRSLDATLAGVGVEGSGSITSRDYHPDRGTQAEGTMSELAARLAAALRSQGS